MRAGNLRHKAMLQIIGNTANEFGEIEEGEYTDYKTVWCSITPVSGKEAFLANVNYAQVSHKIKIRFLSGINSSMRLTLDGRVFDFVHTYDIGERKKEIEILAVEANNG